jgi:hypothetical protein
MYVAPSSERMIYSSLTPKLGIPRGCNYLLPSPTLRNIDWLQSGQS